jgi:hypothetical protein
VSILLAGAFGAACLLLLAAGAAKVVDPIRTVGALAALGWSAPSGAVRLAAAAEAVVGAAGLAVGGAAVAVAVAVSYLAFAVFVVAAMRSGTPVGSCGCLGAVDTPPRVGHVVTNVVLAGGTAVALASGEADALLDAGAAAGAVAVALAAGAYLVMTRRPPAVRLR